jgi:hypothetical protein
MVSEVLPTRQKIWRFRNSFDNKSQKIVLDKYPTFSIAETRLWLEKYCSMDSHGVSPAQKKVGRKLKYKDQTTVKHSPNAF